MRHRCSLLCLSMPLPPDAGGAGGCCTCCSLHPLLPVVTAFSVSRASVQSATCERLHSRSTFTPQHLCACRALKEAPIKAVPDTVQEDEEYGVVRDQVGNGMPPLTSDDPAARRSSSAVC